MVGFNPLDRIQLSNTEHAFAGAVSGAITRMLCQPLDVLKIRFQLQVEPVKARNGSKYHGVIQAVRCIWQEEGLKALWKGHVPAQFLSVIYGVVQYTTFEIFTREIWEHLPKPLTTTYRPATHMLCGGLSGCISVAFIHPMDVIRTRFVAQGEPKVYKSMGSACQMILQKEGVQGFYKGLVPAITLVGPQMGIQFGLYTLFNSLWDKSKGVLGTSPPASFQSLVCGSGSGLLAKLLVHPLDVVKKRLQVQGFEEARLHFGAVHQYKGLWHCLGRCFLEEGLAGLYKGLAPSLLKAAAVAGCNFCVYEETCRLLRYWNYISRS